MICGRGEGLTVIEDQKDMAAAAREAGATVIVGDATKESILRQAGLEDASTLLIALPEGIEAGDRKSVGEGKGVAVRVDLGGRRILKKQKNDESKHTKMTTYATY